MSDKACYWVKVEDELPPIGTVAPVKAKWANGVHLHIGRYIEAPAYRTHGELIKGWIDNDAGDGMHVIEWLKEPN
jgi:hypothetical protein